MRVGVGVLEAAAVNRSAGLDILRLLYKERKNEVLVTADVLETAAKSYRFGKDIWVLLLTGPEQHAAWLRITEDIAIAA